MLDEPGALSPATRDSLSRLLYEHEQATTDQIVIALFNSLEGEDAVEFTARAFREWKIGQASKNNGVLLALYWKERKMRIEVGYGLEPVLTDARSSAILGDDLAPELKAGNPDRGLSLAALAILKELDSPLITSGRASAILSGAVSTAPRYAADEGGDVPLRTWVLVFVILVFFVIPLLSRLSPEAHYTGGGWTTRRRRTVFWGGGGFGGGGGMFGGGGGGGGFGGGGFSGGGGRSGGGGASGSW